MTVPYLPYELEMKCPACEHVFAVIAAVSDGWCRCGADYAIDADMNVKWDVTESRHQVSRKPSGDEDMLGYLTECMRIIDEQGYMVQAVFPTVEEPGFHFCYTVGRTREGHSELIITGLAPESAHTVIDAFMRNRPVSVKLMTLDAPSDLLGVAREIYGDSVTAKQIVWSDAAGRFPGDEGFEHGDRQPILAKAN